MTASSIAIGCDHGGVQVKETVIKHLESLGYSVRDLGTNGSESVDYPDYAQAVAREIVAGNAQSGILICGSGIGMSIAANRFPEIRAALVHDRLSTELCRKHNDANVLCIGARLLGEATILDCISAFVSTAFEGGRHERRIEKLSVNH